MRPAHDDHNHPWEERPGTISVLFGLTNRIISQVQYTILATTVIGSAIVPTLIAQRFFQPALPRFETTEEDIEDMPVPNGTADDNPRVS